MNRLPLRKRVQIVQLLTEGTSIRATARIVDCSKSTVQKLIKELGTACEQFHDHAFRNLKVPLIQVDEIWSFVLKKTKRLKDEEKGRTDIGSVWTWVAMCPTTKIIPAWTVGGRTTVEATELMRLVKRRIKGRTTIITDGYKPYIEAIEEVFGTRVGFARLVKQYDERERYVGAERTVVQGKVPIETISTSHLERMNLTIRMHNRRFNRETNAHSKKIEFHRHSLAILFTYYHFCKIHQTLRVTPAMEANLTDHVWGIDEILGLLD